MLRGAEIRKIQPYSEKPVENHKSTSEKRGNPEVEVKEESIFNFIFDVTQVSVKRAVPPVTSDYL